MTHEELEEAFNAFAAEASGRVIALMEIIRALQAQPGYDHVAFLAALGAIEAEHENALRGRPSALTQEQQQAFDQTVKSVEDRLPPIPEAWIVRPRVP